MSEPRRSLRAAAALTASLVVGSCGGIGSGPGSGFGGGVGPVCGSASLQGERLGRVNGPGRCGIRRAVALHSVGGVALDPPATVGCETAQALERWVERVAKPEAAREGERLVALDVAGGYACRGRNNRRGGPLSEHAYGRAIDISGFRFASGARLEVETDWGSAEGGDYLARIHGRACGIFGTTLGFHEDHFHYDVARHENGPYCR